MNSAVPQVTGKERVVTAGRSTSLHVRLPGVTGDSTEPGSPSASLRALQVGHNRRRPKIRDTP